MEKINDGGPAFPSTLQYFPEDTNYRLEQGMTLRDYFAAKAMQAYISTGNQYGVDGKTFDEYVSKWAYEMADHMLRTREA